jgi:hypothetical protein
MNFISIAELWASVSRRKLSCVSNTHIRCEYVQFLRCGSAHSLRTKRSRHLKTSFKTWGQRLVVVDCFDPRTYILPSRYFFLSSGILKNKQLPTATNRKSCIIRSLKMKHLFGGGTEARKCPDLPPKYMERHSVGKSIIRTLNQSCVQGRTDFIIESASGAMRFDGFERRREPKGWIWYVIRRVILRIWYRVFRVLWMWRLEGFLT